MSDQSPRRLRSGRTFEPGGGNMDPSSPPSRPRSPYSLSPSIQTVNLSAIPTDGTSGDGGISVHKQALLHVIRNVMGLKRDHEVERALPPHFEHYTDIVNLQESECDKLNFPPWFGFLVRQLAAYIAHLHDHERLACTSADILRLTRADFFKFRESYVGRNSQSTTVNPPPRTAAPSSNDYSTLLRSIKKDPERYEIFDQDALYDQWKRSVIATARVQDMSDVLNPAFVPNQDDDNDVKAFNLKQGFMYDVFSRILRTSRGCALVRSYESTYDAQSVWRDLVKQMESSADSRIEYMEIFRYLTQVRLDRSTWHGTCMDFVLHFVDKCRRLDNLRPTSEPPLSEHTKRTLLDAALQGVSSLRDVQIHVDAIDASMFRKDNQATPTDFHGYLDHLKRQCQVLDRQKVAGTARTAPRQALTVYHADVSPEAEATESPFGIDTECSTVMAYRARMTASQWHALPPEAQQLWDQLPDSAKEIILGEKGQGNHPKGRPPNSYRRPPPRRNVQLHEQSSSTGGDNDDHRVGEEATPQEEDDGYDDTTHQDTDTIDLLVQMATTGIDKDAKFLPPGDPRRLLSSTKGKKHFLGKKGSKKQSTARVKMMIMDDNTTYNFNLSAIYTVSQRVLQKKFSSLVDRGANGGMAGTDVRVIAISPHRKVNVQGIDKHQLTDIPIVSCGGVIETRQGKVIAIFHQYAHLPTGPSIHSSGQMEWFRTFVDDRSKKVGGNQMLVTHEGYEVPLNVISGLAYFGLRPYTDDEWGNLPHVVMTSDDDWDPTVLDHDVTSERTWRPTDSVPPDLTPHFDEFGRYRHRTIQAANVRLPLPRLRNSTAETKEGRPHPHDPLLNHPLLDNVLIPDDTIIEHNFCDEYDSDEDPRGDRDDTVVDHDVGLVDDVDRPEGKPPDTVYNAPSPHMVAQDMDPESARRFFAWLPHDIVQKTLECTTQYARVPMSTHLTKHYRSPFPALNVARRDEPVATDSVYSSTPCIETGVSMAQFFVGMKTMVCDVEGIKTDKQFVNSLEDNIRYRGAPTQLISDSARSETSKRVKDILRALAIGDWQSEPHQQHQNPSERRYQTVKRLTNALLDRCGCPPSLWLLAMKYVCHVLNFTVSKSIGYNVPMSQLLGHTVDTSMLLRFHFF